MGNCCDYLCLCFPVKKVLDNPPLKGQTRYAQVTVIDGDTLNCRLNLGWNFYETHVRLLGCDTPETHRADSKEEMVAGNKVKAFVEKLIAENTVKNIAQVTIVKNDKFGGRVLGYVLINGKSLAKILLDLKYARVYDGKKKIPWTSAELSYINQNLP